MQRLDRDIHLCKALVIDSNATSRSVLVGQLRDFGVGAVTPCGRIADARAQLESHTFDIVLCELGFTGTEYSGQQLLDDLRRSHLLPLSTVFIMITAEASYAKVAEAAESALDGYLLKPHTATALGERVTQSRRRKKVLKDIFEAVDEGRFDDAANLCLARFRARGEYWLFAARIGAELMLQGGRNAEAREFYAAVVAAQAVPWARLGIARAQLEAGETTKAVQTLGALIAENTGFVDAHDVMGRARLQQGDFDAAGTAFRQAATLTPGSISRLQKLGTLAFYAGDHEEASRALDRATLLGISSKMFDFQSCVLLAMLRFQQRDAKGLQRCADNLVHALQKAPQSGRLQRFVRVATALVAMMGGRLIDGAVPVRQLADELRAPSFDPEAAGNLLALLSHVYAAGVSVEGATAWVEAIGLRHCTGKAFTELLLRCARVHAPFQEQIRQCQQTIAEAAETAMQFSLAGDPGQAVRLLVHRSRQTLNAKLIDTARLVLQRHAASVEDATALHNDVEDLRRQFAAALPKAPLSDGSGRKAGALVLRTAAAEAAEAEEATPVRETVRAA